jgi:hypothetical protein
MRPSWTSQPLHLMPVLADDEHELYDLPQPANRTAVYEHCASLRHSGRAARSSIDRGTGTME